MTFDPAADPNHPGTTTMSLVRIITEEEREYASLQLHITWRTGQISRLEAELEPIQTAFEAFEWEYTQRVGHLAAELASLRTTTRRLEHQTARVHARIVADPGGVLGDLFDETELREIGEMFGIDVPDEWFAAAKRQRPAAGAEWDWASAGEEEILRQRKRPTQPQLPDDDARELKTRYRDLARRFHPDLADDDDERVLRQELMLRINHAWHCQDLDALRDLEVELERALPGWSASRIAHRLAWARRESARLDARATSLIARIRQLRASETFPLWFNSTLGRTVITQRANALRHDLQLEESRLDAAKSAFKHALAHYAAAIA